jgi:hypothetical protein
VRYVRSRNAAQPGRPISADDVDNVVDRRFFQQLDHDVIVRSGACENVSDRILRRRSVFLRKLEGGRPPAAL